MICKNCGAEFAEGIFCPECGTKVEVELSAEEKEQLEKDAVERELLLAKQKAEQERLAKEREEADRLEREKQEQERKAEEERLAKEKAEAERLENERKEKERAEREKAFQEQEVQLHIMKEQMKLKKAEKAAENEGKVMAVLSLLCGLGAVFTLGVLVIPEILGIVFACLGKKQGKMRGMAKAGLICSIIASAIIIWLFVSTAIELYA